MADRPLLLSLPPYRYLADAIAAKADVELGEVQFESFADAERYQRLVSPVNGRFVVILGGTIDDESTLRLYDLANAAVKYGAERLLMVVPYFGYSTMERAVKSGEVVTAKTRARLLSSVPIASRGNRLLLVDLHSEGIVHYFEGGLTAFHVSARSLIAEIARRLGGGDFVLGSTDAGRAKWVEKIARELAIEPAFVYKRRINDEQTEVTAVNANVTGRRVVVYDDMIRSGSSLLGAARAYKHAGASELFAVATHAIFPGEAFAHVRSSGLFQKIVATDTHPRARELESQGLEVVSIASLLASRIE